ncbi:MAG: hypothetical protein ACSHXZ_12435 [Gammaproteobacteria bacterium]
MSGEIIDLTAALEQRQFKAKEERLKNMRDAFRAARLDAKPALKTPSPRTSGSKRKKKSPKPSR